MLGPTLATFAVVVSVGILIVTLVRRGHSAPVLERLGGIEMSEDLLAVVRGARGISVRAGAASLALRAADRGRDIVESMYDSTAVPGVVLYTVTSGGTLRDVANSFGIYHHEIEKMNPGLTLGSSLSAGARVVVYRRDMSPPSRSVGRASSGSLEGAVPMLEGPGRILRRNRFKCWATAATVARTDWALRQWVARYPKAQVVLVGNLSLRTGGRVKPHRTHQAGRSVDFSYIQKWDGVSEIHWRDMTERNLDPVGTWQLLHIFMETEAIDVFYIDYALQELLYKDALARGIYNTDQLRGLMQYPDGSKASDRLIKHAPGHVNHIHVRYRCSPHDSACLDS